MVHDDGFKVEDVNSNDVSDMQLRSQSSADVVDSTKSREVPREEAAAVPGVLLDLSDDQAVAAPRSAWQDPQDPQAKLSGSLNSGRQGSNGNVLSSDKKDRRRSNLVQGTQDLQALNFGFIAPSKIKENVKAALSSKPTHKDVTEYYYTTGVFQYVARHPIFENATLAVIALNAVYIAIDTDWNKDAPLEAQSTRDLEDSPWYFFSMEHLFCIYFTIELIIRFGAFARKRDCLKSGWFVFDSILVVLMVFETWILLLVGSLSGTRPGSILGDTAVLRLFRLLRLSRLLRMLKSLTELRILVKGMITAMTSVFYVMCLLVSVTYIFAIAFTQLAVGTETVGQKYFANVSLSMYSLLIHAAFMDDMAEFMNDLRFEYWPLVGLALIFVCFASLTLMNMLIGVLCEVVSAVATTERAENRSFQVQRKMETILKNLDENLDEMISYSEFSKMIAKPEALRCLQEVDVDPLSVIDFADMFFFEDGHCVELTFEEFMEVVMSLRESNQSTYKDVLKLWMQIKTTTNTMIEKIDTKVNQIDKKIDMTALELGNKIDQQTEMLRKLMEGGSPSPRDGARQVRNKEGEQSQRGPDVPELIAKSNGNANKFTSTVPGFKKEGSESPTFVGSVSAVPGSVRRIGAVPDYRSQTKTSSCW